MSARLAASWDCWRSCRTLARRQSAVIAPAIATAPDPASSPDTEEIRKWGCIMVAPCVWSLAASSGLLRSGMWWSGAGVTPLANSGIDTVE